VKHPLQLQFLGATNTVTGSKYLLQAGGRRLLVDCGLFQGWKQLRLKNWAPPPFAVNSLDAVLLTHAHIDHSGYLPVLARRGYHHRVYCSHGTRALAEILLVDAAHLQEEEANYANKHRFSRHQPALPLFTTEDARAVCRQFAPVTWRRALEVAPGLTALWRPNGHILGSASIEVRYAGVSVAFSGDLGRQSDPLMRAPETIAEADYLVVESTYGDRLHPTQDTGATLRDIVRRTVARGGSVLIPAFAVGRAQLVLHHLYRLRERGELPAVPIYINSPMAIDATAIYRDFADEHRLDEREYAAMCRMATFVRTPEESKRLCERREPMIVISASGMATGGRVLHHLVQMAPDERNAIVFTGFQSSGTRGATLVGGADVVRIFGQLVPIRAEVCNIETMSAHADQAELLQWLAAFKRPPRQVFITHGEPAAADALRQKIEQRFGWSCTVPEYRDEVELG